MNLLSSEMHYEGARRSRTSTHLNAFGGVTRPDHESERRPADGRFAPRADLGAAQPHRPGGLVLALFERIVPSGTDPARTLVPAGRAAAANAIATSCERTFHSIAIFSLSLFGWRSRAGSSDPEPSGCQPPSGRDARLFAKRRIAETFIAREATFAGKRIGSGQVSGNINGAGTVGQQTRLEPPLADIDAAGTREGFEARSLAILTCALPARSSVRSIVVLQTRTALPRDLPGPGTRRRPVRRPCPGSRRARAISP